MPEDINDWGMDFIGRIDKIVTEKKGDLQEQWMEGDWESVLNTITLGDYLTEEQVEWVDTFLSEI